MQYVASVAGSGISNIHINKQQKFCSVTFGLQDQ